MFKNKKDFYLKHILFSVYERIAANRIDLIFVVILLLAIIKQLLFTERALDLILWDETSLYLNTGVTLLKSGAVKLFTRAEWGFLYSLWYFLLSLFIKNNVHLYYLNFKLLISLNVLCIYFLTRRMGCIPITAFIGAFIFLATGYNAGSLYDTVSVSQFALFVLLIFSILGTYIRSDEKYCYLTAFGLFLVVFVRPEFKITFFIYCFLCARNVLIDLRKGVMLKREHLGGLFVFLTAIVILLAVLGNPMMDNDRSWITFKQHFLYNNNEWNNSSVNVSDCDRIISSVFGKANSILGAAANNPAAFSRYVLYNLGHYLMNSCTSLIVHFSSYTPYNYNYPLITLQFIAYLALFMVLLRKRREIAKGMNDTMSRRFLLLLISLYPPIILSTLIAISLLRYIIIQKAFILILLCYLIHKAFPGWQNMKMSIAKQAFIGLFVLAFIPNLHYGSSLDFWRNIGTYRSHRTLTRNVDTINFIRSLNIKKEVNMLSNACYTVYAGENFNWIPLWDKRMPFNRFIRDRKINMIFLDSRIENDPNYYNDKEFKEFLINFMDHGFKKVLIDQWYFGPPQDYLFIKTDLLAK